MRAPLHTHLDAHDNELLARLRAGDDVAFGALVERHRPWLVRLCTRLLGYDAHAAEDAAQESLLKLHAAARREGQPLRVRPWLTVVARHTCVDEQRRRRPDLPGDLPERAVPGDDPFLADAALADAWPRLSGRHREVLYLREVLGFSYKEIGAVMGLSLPATETLVFRARAALRREYERSGGTAVGCGLLGFRLARLGFGRRRDVVVPDRLSNAAMNDGGLSGVGSRLAQWVQSSLPGYCEPAVAKALSVAAGVVVTAAAVLPGFGPLGAAPPAAAATAPARAMSAGLAPTAVTIAAGGSPAGVVPVSQPVGLKGLLGNAVPADWAPHRTRGEAAAPTIPNATAAAPAPNDPRPRITPLRDAAAAAKPSEAPTLRRPVRGDTPDPGPIRAILPERPGPVDRPERPSHPLRALLADPQPLPIDRYPAAPPPEPGPSVRDVPAPASAPPLATVAGHDPALLRRGHG